MSKREKIPERASDHLVRWYGEHLPRDVVVLRGSWFGRLFGAFGQSAVTINGTVRDALNYWDHPQGISVIAVGGDKL